MSPVGSTPSGVGPAPGEALADGGSRAAAVRIKVAVAEAVGEGALGDAYTVLARPAVVVALPVGTRVDGEHVVGASAVRIIIDLDVRSVDGGREEGRSREGNGGR